MGGAQCPPQLMQDIEAAFGVRIGNMYGMGENIVHTRTLPTDPPEIVRDTVGQPVPGAELAIFADDHTTELDAGEVGEVAFRGPTLFLGYYKQPELTRATRNADGWFFTGDLGFVDARGYLHLAGRKKELINRGGTKIFPKEIEDLLHAHPKIVRAAVVGMPDYRLGERVCAYVELTPGETLDLAELRDRPRGPRDHEAPGSRASRGDRRAPAHPDRQGQEGPARRGRHGEARAGTTRRLRRTACNSARSRTTPSTACAPASASSARAATCTGPARSA